MPDNDSLSPIERTLPQRINSFTPTTLDLEAQASDTHFTFASFWHIVVKRLATILTAALVVLVLTAIYTFRMAPVYRATSSMEVAVNYPEIQSLSETYRPTLVADDEFLTTEIQVLQSDSLAWTTMQQLGIDRGAPAERPLVSSGQSATQIARTRKTTTIEGFKEGLTIEPLKDSRILTVSYESKSPEMAADVVNHLVRNFIDFNFQVRNDFTRRASGGMEAQLEELKAKMERSQQALVDYERQNLIIPVAGDKGTTTDQSLEALNKEFVGRGERPRSRSSPFTNSPRPIKDRWVSLSRTRFSAPGGEVQRS